MHIPSLTAALDIVQLSAFQVCRADHAVGLGTLAGLKNLLDLSMSCILVGNFQTVCRTTTSASVHDTLSTDIP